MGTRQDDHRYPSNRHSDTELLAPSIETRGDMRELVMVPLGAVVLALIIGIDHDSDFGAPATILELCCPGRRRAWFGKRGVETLTAAIPLVLAGLGIGLAFRAGLFNIGAEGQMVVGAICDGGKLQHHRLQW